MSFVDLSVVILASMVAILAGMVGYMYWQQSRILHAVSSLSVFVTSQFIKQPDLELEEDDRESVEETPKEVETSETPETKESPVEVVEDVDDLQGKTSSELKELLSKKGIPYGKRDSKSVLLQLLKAAS
jgi:flagellar basal body-associated protein FliL